jgi:trimethylamine:corrinoid methyltransferase-like protein
MSERPPITPLRRDFTVRFHEPAQLERLKQATLDILDRVGVRVDSQRALDLLTAHGARVERSTRIVTFPADMVLAAMSRGGRGGLRGAPPHRARPAPPRPPPRGGNKRGG